MRTVTRTVSPGRRPSTAWLATWAHRWALGAAGSVEVDENPAQTLARELWEEWAVEPERLSVEALVALPTGITMLVGMAWLAEGATVTPDAEHDEMLLKARAVLAAVGGRLAAEPQLTAAPR